MTHAINAMLHDYRLTTAQILYHMPDHPHILQSYLWQEYDLAPQFPKLHDFLDFWNKSLDGKLHSVAIAHVGVISASDFQRSHGNYLIH